MKETGEIRDTKEIKREQVKKLRIRASIRMFVLGFVFALVLCVSYCLISGRFMTNAEYSTYLEYKNSYGKYYELMNFIDKNALNEYKGSRLDDSIYRDIISSLGDPYAEYYTPEEYANFERKFSESYVGIGIAVMDDTKDNVVIVQVMEGAPAEEAGILPGDIITKVDGKKVTNSTDATSRIAGDVGTSVTVSITRNGEAKEFTLDRQKITQKSVSYKKLDKKNKIGYIAISMFKEGTYQEFKNAVKDLKNDGYEKIVIDLRDNGGGSTVEAYNIADYLLPECSIVQIYDKNGKKEEVKSDSTTAGIEYVLLVNENTASASEIVACAVQDNKGGKIIGSKTFGKGVTQQTHALTDGSVVKITIEEYKRPSGKKVNGVGIKPDINADSSMSNDDVLALAIKTLTE